jgi:broad specificity phosphatase PhoE
VTARAPAGAVRPARRLILVRHARTVPDPALPAEEWVLADEAAVECSLLARRLRRLRPDRVVTSTHGKAIATGRLLADALGLPCETGSGLEEHDRAGVAFVTDEGEWLAALEQVFARPDEVVLGTESAHEACDRFEAAVRHQAALRPGENLILATHATVMALLLARHNGFEAFEFWRTIRMPDAIVVSLPDFRLLERFGPR